MADVITGEAVALELPVANFPSRIAALLIDMAVQIVLLLVVVIALATTSGQVNGDYIAAEFVTANVVVLHLLSDRVRDPEQGQDARQDGARDPGRWRRRQPGAIPAGACARPGRRTRDLDHCAGPDRSDYLDHLG